MEDDLARRLRAAESQLVPAGTPGAGAMVTLATKEAIMAAVERFLARIEAFNRIKMAALAATNRHDWVAHAESDDPDVAPYLQESGCEKLMQMFGVEIERDGGAKLTYADDQSFEFVYEGRARALVLSEIWYPVVGSRWSGDGFFTKGGKIRPDPGDVRKAALTNLFNRAIKTVLGLRNLTWDDLATYARIKREDVPVVTFEGGKFKAGARRRPGRARASPRASTSRCSSTTRTRPARAPSRPCPRTSGPSTATRTRSAGSSRRPSTTTA